jgi:cobalt-precorrin 5A hydrolase
LKIAFFSFTDCGERLKSRLSACLLRNGHEIFVVPPDINLKDQAAAAFKGADALFFIGAAGIAVRTIAPFVHSKISDPSVIVVDELGKWVIPILGGHIGGGNELALEVSRLLECEAVITTATDIHKVFAVDTWASRQNLVMNSMTHAKKVSAALLKGGCVSLQSDYPIEGIPPSGVVYQSSSEKAADFRILVSMKRSAEAGDVLQLIPRRVYAGIGCRKGSGVETIAEVFDYALEILGFDSRCIAGAASIDMKKTEKGLIDFCGRRDIPCFFFDAAELRRVKGSFSASRFVEDTTGVDNVCERSAVLASGNGELLLKKTARGGVTVAFALKDIGLRFPCGE